MLSLICNKIKMIFKIENHKIEYVNIHHDYHGL